MCGYLNGMGTMRLRRTRKSVKAMRTAMIEARSAATSAPQIIIIAMPAGLSTILLIAEGGQQVICIPCAPPICCMPGMVARGCESCSAGGG